MIKLFRTTLFSLILTSCAAVQLEEGVSAAFSVVDLDCASCGAELVGIVNGVDGAKKAQFHKMAAEVSFRYDPLKIEPAQVFSEIEKAGFKVVEGTGKGTYQPYPDYPEGADVCIIDRGGTEIELDSQLKPGKITVIDFYAPWCGPCRVLGKSLVKILASNPQIALVKINVVDWGSPIAKQHLENVPMLPYVRIYDPEGALIDDISGLDLKRLEKALGLKSSDTSSGLPNSEAESE
jgi:thioredoxin 1